MRSVRLMCAIALALGCLAASPAAVLAAASDGSGSVLVAADRAWTDTGIDVAPEDTAEVRAAGLIQIAESDYPGKSPDGDRGCVGTGAFVALGLHCWALIGRVGSGAPVEVGSAGSVPAGSGGRLYLGVNDDFFADNRGVWLAGGRIGCQCVGYVKNRFGLTGAAGNAKDMGPFLASNGFRPVDTPVPGAVAIFQPTPWGLTEFGHVAVIGSVQDLGDRWVITTVGANQPVPPESEHTEANCDNISTEPWAPYPKSRDGVSITYWIRGGH